MKSNNKNKNNIPIKAASLVMSATMVGTAVPFASVFANAVKDDDSGDNSNIVIDANDLADTTDSETSDSPMAYGATSASTIDVKDSTGKVTSLSFSSDSTLRSVLTKLLDSSSLDFAYDDSTFSGCQLVRVNQETDAYVTLKTNDTTSVVQFNYDKYQPTSNDDSSAHQKMLADMGVDPSYGTVDVPSKNGEYSKVDMDTMSLTGFQYDVKWNDNSMQRYAILDSNGSLVATIGFKSKSDNKLECTSLINQEGKECTITFRPGSGTFTNGQRTNTSKYGSTDVIGYFEYGKDSATLDGYNFKGWLPQDVTPIDGSTVSRLNFFGDYTFLKKDVTFDADFVKKDPVGTRYDITYKFVGDYENERADIVVQSDKIGVNYSSESDKTGSSDLSFLGDFKGYDFAGLFDGSTKYATEYEVGTVVEEPTTVYVKVYSQFVFVVLDDNGQEVTRSSPISWTPDLTLADCGWELPEELFRISDTGYTAVVRKSDLASSFVLNKDETYIDKPKDNIRVIGSVGNGVGYNIVYLRQRFVTPVQTYNLTFDGNGGTVSGGSTLNRDEGDVVGTMPTASMTGYVFAGWYTEKTGGTRITDNTPVTKDETYYAHWTRQGATVDFDLNGGNLVSGSDSIVVPIGTSITTLPTVSRNGYTFDGWYTAQTGGTDRKSTRLNSSH